MIPWNTGQVVWGSVDGVNNVVQLSTQMPDKSGNLYWWRNMLPNEELHDACLDWWQFTIPWAQIGSTVASIQVNEWSPNGEQLIQNRGFAAYTDSVDIFTQS